MRNVFVLGLFIVGCELVGLLGTPFTLTAVNGWYATLVKPSFSPPNWIFGPVWTLLYLCMGIAAYLVWRRGLKKQAVKTALVWFSVQLAFNFLWSLIFFGLQQPLLALVDIIALWIAILITMIKFYPLSKPAAYLLVPYLLWVSFASLLNLSIVILNS